MAQNVPFFKALGSAVVKDTRQNDQMKFSIIKTF